MTVLCGSPDSHPLNAIWDVVGNLKGGVPAVALQSQGQLRDTDGALEALVLYFLGTHPALGMFVGHTVRTQCQTTL